jgi:hypothetical protein
MSMQMWKRMGAACQKAHDEYTRATGVALAYYHRVDAHPDVIDALRAEYPGWPDSSAAIAVPDPSMPKDRIAFHFAPHDEWQQLWRDELARRTAAYKAAFGGAPNP